MDIMQTNEDKELSFWEVDDLEGMDTVADIIASGLKSKASLDLVAVESGDLQKHFDYNQKPGATSYKEKNLLHRNVIVQNYRQVGEIALIIKAAIEREECVLHKTAKELRNSLKKLISEGKIKEDRIDLIKSVYEIE